MLLSSFLGVGAGAMAGKFKWSLFEWFPVFLACDIATLILCRDVTLGASPAEARFNTINPTLLNTLVLIWIFAINALLFVPLGQRLGGLFNSLPRLSAYAWDLAGSLCGTLCFGLFSLTHFSPLLGMVGLMGVYLLMAARNRRVLDVPVFVAVLTVMFASSD